MQNPFLINLQYWNNNTEAIFAQDEAKRGQEQEEANKKTAQMHRDYLLAKSLEEENSFDLKEKKCSFNKSKEEKCSFAELLEQENKIRSEESEYRRGVYLKMIDDPEISKKMEEMQAGKPSYYEDNLLKKKQEEFDYELARKIAAEEAIVKVQQVALDKIYAKKMEEESNKQAQIDADAEFARSLQ